MAVSRLDRFDLKIGMLLTGPTAKNAPIALRHIYGIPVEIRNGEWVPILAGKWVDADGVYVILYTHYSHWGVVCLVDDIAMALDVDDLYHYTPLDEDVK